uniref:glutathione transferase n=1 Tax=Panagrellus redivivus TaxID=6233 RepID=A0A7E4UUW3_PANRE
MVHYKLYYFPIRGIVEPIRDLLKYAKADFEDVRIPKEEWPQFKEKTPTGKVPYLEFEGNVIPESMAILRYLGREFNLNGANNVEAAEIDSVVEVVKDTANKVRDYIRVARGLQEGDRIELFRDLYVPNRDVLMAYITKQMQKSKSGFLLNSGVSWADFFLAETFETLSLVDEDFNTRYPGAAVYKRRVFNLPNLKEYIDSRPEGSF